MKPSIYKYGYIKNYVEVESQSGCLLIEYKNINEIILKCKCGEEFKVSFYNFKNKQKYQCNVCSGYTDWNIDSVRLFFKEYNYELLTEEYKNLKQKLTIVDIEGYYYLVNLGQFLLFQTPRKMHKTNPYSIKNINHWIKINNKPYELIDEVYKGNDKKLKFKCLIEGCKETFFASWNDISHNTNCGYCTGQQVGLSNCLATKNPKLASEWHPTLNGDLTPYDVTCGSGKFAWWKCQECGYEWEVAVYGRSIHGCPECNKSKGEKRIDECLINKGLIKISQEEFEQLNQKYKIKYFVTQMKYEDLIGLGGGLLLYDHYIPKINLLIEYDGEFHYKPIKNNKNEPIKYAEERLRKQQHHDQLKNEYAEFNNIKLLRIPYWDFDNIETILDKYLRKEEYI